jgi:putative DNA primase/helicase
MRPEVASDWTDGTTGDWQIPGDSAESNKATAAPVDADEETLQQLAALSALEYERKRKAEAERLGWRITILDELVANRRPPSVSATGELPGRTLNLPDIEPWPEPVNGAEVLHETAETYSRYVALPAGAADALALWCAHAHAFTAFQHSSRAHISSPEKCCGKSTLRDVIATLVPRPLPTENLSVAVLFRVIEKHRPTVLADECDAWINDNEELRGLLNAGHRRGGQALRCEGENNEVRASNVFGPAVLCGIGALLGTLHDCSIVIRLERAKPGELRQRFDSRHVEREAELCRKLARFTADNIVSLEASDAKLPNGVFNRLADNWRPLFAIAKIAGGDWPERCAAAFIKLTSRDDLDAQGIGTMLLADIQQIFAGKWPPPPEGVSPLPVERVFSKDLIEKLAEMKERPWLEICRGKPITARWLARNLADFGIHSGNIWDGEKQEQAKGYERAHFDDVFARYIPETPEGGNLSVQPSNTEVKPGNSIRPKEKVWTDEKKPIHEAIGRLDGSKGGKAEKGDKVI